MIETKRKFRDEKLQIQEDNRVEIARIREEMEEIKKSYEDDITKSVAEREMFKRLHEEAVENTVSLKGERDALSRNVRELNLRIE